MQSRYYKLGAVIVTMTVLFFVATLTGCVTKRDIEEVKDRLSTIEGQNSNSQRMVARMDSIIAAGAESNTRLRNDIRISIDQIDQQIGQLLENYNELLQMLEKLNRRPQVIRKPPTSSAGAQDNGTQTGNTTPPPNMVATYDCIGAYDDAFVLVLASEYKKAIKSFRSFLEKCGDNSENVDNAYYWIGECYYSLEDYTSAITELGDLIKKFPQSAKLAPARYKLARSHQELGHKKDARTLFEQIVQNHPGTLEAEQASQRIKDLK